MGQAGGPKAILVVEDDPGIGGLIVEVLIDLAGYQADIALDGVTALTHLAGYRFQRQFAGGLSVRHVCASGRSGSPRWREARHRRHERRGLGRGAHALRQRR